MWIHTKSLHRFDKGENIEAYYKTIGRSDMIKHFRDYRVSS
jgi:hypothetical protein